MADIAVSTFIESIGGHPVVVKHRLAGFVDRSNPAPPTLLAERQTEFEGRWLSEARHRHVVRLRRALPTEAALATDHAGVHNLASCRHPPASLASILTTVAKTLVDLHGRGLVHGRIVPSHVVLRGPRLLDPVLCSPSPEHPGDRLHPRRDVEALAVMACELMAPVREICELAAGEQLAPRRRAWAGWSEAIEQLACDEAAVSAFGAAEIFASLARRPRRSWLRG